MQSYDLVIVGGGAAGLAAAVMAGTRYLDIRIAVLEKAARVGKKLLATGNGTCNISNIHASKNTYHGGGLATVETVLDRFSVADARAFFSAVGVETVVREDGRVYPLCASAAAVLDRLRLAAGAVADIYTDCAVSSLHPTKTGVKIHTDSEEFTALAVIVAVGGAASPSCGGSADGYGLLTALGHTRTPLFPSVVQLRTDAQFVRAVKGLRIDATVTLSLDDRPLVQKTGEILFTEYGLSGPAVMHVSRAAGEWERRKKGTLNATLDLLPDYDRETLKTLLFARKTALKDTLREDFLTGLFQRRIGQTVMRVADVMDWDKPVSTLTDAELIALCNTIKGWSIAVLGTQGFGGAQVTAGGLSVSEFSDTLVSLKYPRIAAVGEVLDVDGDCGGYNLQWAWSSAFSAVCGLEGVL